MKKQERKGYFKLREINPVIRFLTISDLLILSGFGFVAPIFAIFITDSIQGGTIEVAGIAAAIYLFSKSLGQIPAASIVDRIKGEIDDFWTLIVGSFLFSIIPLFYIIINTPIQLYIVQVFYGLATAVAVPTWYALFTRHIDKDHEGIEWGVYQTLVDLGGAGTAFAGGLLVAKFGFSYLFVLVSIISLVGSFFLLGAYKYLNK